MKSKRTPSLDLENIMPMLINIWRRFHKEAGPGDKLQTREFRRVVDSVKKIHSRHTGKESLIGQDYFSDREMLSAYMLYQWVIHYQEGMALLSELPTIPKRVLDVCSGPAPYAFAALRMGAREVFATDRNMMALELGAEACGRYGLPLTIRKWDCLKSQMPVEGNFDLIILGHCLEELFPASEKNWQDRQSKFVHYLLDRLTPGGFLLIVDSSLTEDNRRVLMLRDQIVNAGVPVQAPCVWKGECVALKSNSSCYAQREMEKPYLIKEIQRAAEINLGSLKMSYVIFKSPKASWPVLQEDKNYYRVISPPFEAHKGKRFYLCGTDGKKILESHFTEHPPESRAFEYLRRGELISIEDGLVQQNAIDIVKGTKVIVDAPVSKPIPEKEDYE